jgi:hypothetical protein
MLVGVSPTLLPWIAMTVILTASVGIARGLPLLSRLRLRRRMTATRGQSLRRRVSLALPLMRGDHQGVALREMLRLLVAEGCTNVTVRVGRNRDLAAITPLEMPFEPVPLDAAPDQLVAPDRAVRSGSPAILPRALRRNIILRGGWILLALFLFNAVMAALSSMAQGRVTPGLVFWSLAVAVTLFVPASFRPLGGKQWLVVPGGLLRRTAGWRQRGWTLTLFTRADSALCVGRHRRQRWIMAVSDATGADFALLTREESEALLRAWLSHVPPPPADRLSDLMASA